MNELKNKQLHAALALLGVTLFVVLFYAGLSTYLNSKLGPSVPIAESPLSEPEFREVLEESVSGNDPKPLQDFFADRVGENINNEATKSAIYWITHRYFDNGGDIYEIYDFIEARPEVAFLKEAEKAYPAIFDAIRARTVANYSRDSLLALLSYYDVIDAKGYADIAIWGMAANKYAELAQGGLRMHEANPRAKYSASSTSPLLYMTNMIDRSFYYVYKTHAFLELNTARTGTLDELLGLPMIPDDLLVGLNQYSAAVENLRAVGHVFQTPFLTADLYEFNAQLAEKQVPRLYFFTNYLYASALVNGGSATKENVAIPLERALAYAESTDPLEWRASVSRVINAKTAAETGMYSYETVKTLASLNTGFKEWLGKQGWIEGDFK